jgi:hypothetical protein
MMIVKSDKSDAYTVRKCAVGGRHIGRQADCQVSQGGLGLALAQKRTSWFCSFPSGSQSHHHHHDSQVYKWSVQQVHHHHEGT